MSRPPVRDIPDEKWFELIGPSIMVPAQMFEPARIELPEHRLMLAVLQNALDDLRAASRVRQRARDVLKEQRAETIAWFCAEDDANVFGFESICAALHLPADAIRCALARRDWRLEVRSVKIVPARRKHANVSGVHDARQNRPRASNSPYTTLWEATG